MNTNRTFTVKTVGGLKENIEVTPDDTFDTFCRMIMTTFDFEDDRRLKVIHNGSVVNETGYRNIPDRATIICLATKSSNSPNQHANPTNSSTSAPLPSTTTTSSSNSQNSNETTYTFKQVQAYTVVFMNFISANPQLRNAFLNDYGLLVTELAKNEQLMDVMKNILSQTGQIIEAMEKGENIKLNINTDTNEMERIELTKEDTDKINKLISMGFNPDKVVVTYLKSGKDIQKTLMALQTNA